MLTVEAGLRGRDGFRAMLVFVVDDQVWEKDHGVVVPGRVRFLDVLKVTISGIHVRRFVFSLETYLSERSVIIIDGLVFVELPIVFGVNQPGDGEV